MSRTLPGAMLRFFSSLSQIAKFCTYSALLVRVSSGNEQPVVFCSLYIFKINIKIPAYEVGYFTTTKGLCVIPFRFIFGNGCYISSSLLLRFFDKRRNIWLRLIADCGPMMPNSIDGPSCIA